MQNFVGNLANAFNTKLSPRWSSGFSKAIKVTFSSTVENSNVNLKQLCFLERFNLRQVKWVKIRYSKVKVK